MLLPRVISAIFMAIIFISAVFFLNEIGFMLFIGAVLIIAAWEWARLSSIENQQARFAFAGVVGVLTCAIAVFDVQREMLWFAPWLWLVALYWVSSYPTEKSWKYIVVKLLFGTSILLTTWCALVVLKQSSQFFVYLFILMGLIWGADTGAYCFGRLFGKRKLAKYVSPGKSWEGVLGGVLCTQTGLLIYSVSQGFSLLSVFELAFIGFVVAAVSVLGDLTESLFKRHEGLKDSSKLIPGHGGVMDRIDSVTSSASIFVLLLIGFGWL